MERIEKLVIVLLVAIAVAISVGCSFHIGIDYHGKSGIDNKTQTQLAKGKVIRAD